MILPKLPRLHIQHVYITHIALIEGIPYLIPTSEGIGNNVLSIGDSYENIDRVIKRLDITIRFDSFSVMYILLLYGSAVG